MEAKAGDQVKVHYQGTLDDGSMFDSSEGRDPLAFTLGEKQVIPGFEDAVQGMKTGDTKTVHIPAADAYGPMHEEMILRVPKGDLPDHVKPEEGQQLQMRQESGQTVMVRVSEVTETEITLDANHPLAGQNLNFEIELVAIG